LAELVLTVVDRQGEGHELRARDGETLMPLLRDKVDVTVGVCGGMLSCGTCLVLPGEGWESRIPPPAEDEQEMLEALEAPPGARLACQIVLPKEAGGLALTIAPER
jgi:2Fe-2S ferredoxin